MLDELKLRYKELPIFKRMLVCSVLSIIPAILVYFDEAPTISDEISKAEEEEKAAAGKLLAADNQLKNLEKTENDLIFTRNQLKKAETRLPDTIAIDDVLRTVGKVAKDMSVSVQLFEPQPEILRGDEYKYSELPIKMTIEGDDYSQICEWMDRLSGLKSKMYLRSWIVNRKLKPITLDSQSFQGTRRADGVAEVDPDKLAAEIRRNVRIEVAAEFSFFKLASPAQLAAIAAAAAAEEAAKNPKPKVDPKSKAGGAIDPKKNQAQTEDFQKEEEKHGGDRA